jgi:hypothetical protein
MAGLGQGCEDVCPLKADVAQEMVVQLAEGGDLPTVLGRAGEAEEGWEEAWHLSLLFHISGTMEIAGKNNQAAFSAWVAHPASAQHSSAR